RVGGHGGPLDHLRAFLERCDLVKFAKLRPPEDASRQILAVARAIVEETRPRVGEAGVAAATASGGTGARGRATDVEDAPPTRGAGGPATDVAGSSHPAGLEGP
ncbi:MAG TPA: hypothetical protein VK849_12960, partial [Longimicrobiales bacterium]|nr:hypothetical protein [Longimicrobiales bacterium]